jgi:multicomponent Na+:H+ antiporter subunit D
LNALLPIALLLPLAAVPLIVLLGGHPNRREAVSLITGGLLFALIVALLPEVATGGRPAWTLAEPIPGIVLAFEVEPLGLVMALVASFLWVVTTVYAIGYMRGHHEQNQTRFYAFFAIAIASTIGAAFSANLVTLFVFYEALTLSTFPLVTHAGTDEARRAGRTYLGVLIGSSIALLLLAIVWTWNLAGSVDFTPGGILAGHASDGTVLVLYALFLFGIGKAALMPLHRWLPAAMVAPTPVSALLHAVAVVKIGVFSVLKVSVYIFGPALLTSSGAGTAMAYVAATTVLLGSLVAMRQDNLKRRLAYSTVSQLSYIVLGATLANAWGIVGGGLHIVMHAFGKITLFFCAGAILVAAHKTEVSEMRGLGRRMPLTMAAFLVASLSIIGLPPFGGMWSKWYLLLGALEAEQLVLIGVLMVSSLLNVAYLLPIPVLAFFGKTPDAEQAPGMREAPWPALAALLLTAFGSLVLFLFPGPLVRLLEQLV